MVIGVDFDNTIVRYDDLFHRIAGERGLIPASLKPRKNDVRDFLRRQNRECDWTELQGYVYGARMSEAQPFPGVLEFFARGVRQGLSLCIISHKTRIPAIGPAYDLHRAASDWLEAQGFFDPARIGFSPRNVYFSATRREKVQLIRENGCTHFIDDLEETFLEDSFPPGVIRILFDHRQPPPELPTVMAAETWSQISEYVFNTTK